MNELYNVNRPGGTRHILYTTNTNIYTEQKRVSMSQSQGFLVFIYSFSYFLFFSVLWQQCFVVIITLASLYCYDTVCIMIVEENECSKTETDEC